MSVGTYTYTWVQTRLETIQDQFRYLLIYGDIRGGEVDALVDAVGRKAIEAVGLYGHDGSGLRVIEVELRVNWAHHAELTLSIPTITGGLSGWDDGTKAPETRVAGRRFANAAKQLQLTTNYWVRFIPSIVGDPAGHDEWKRHLKLGGSVPAWKSPPEERAEDYLDLNEASIVIRRAGG